MSKRIAITTGGGDAPGLNAVIRAVTLSAIKRGWSCLGIRCGFDGLLHSDEFDDGGAFELTPDSVRGIAHTGGTILGTTNRGNPFSYEVECESGEKKTEDISDRELIEEFGRVSRAVAVATLLSALAQGLLAGLGFYFCGLESIFLLTLLSAVLAMVPFVGAASIWMPCCLYLYFVDQNITAAIGLAIYGFAVISMADNIIKPIVLHGQSNLHPLLALLSVIGGVSTLGPIGIVIGPMIVVFLQTLLKILRRELDGIEHEVAAQ